MVQLGSGLLAQRKYAYKASGVNSNHLSEINISLIPYKAMYIAVKILDIINRAYAQISCMIKKYIFLTPQYPRYFTFAESKQLHNVISDTIT